MKPLELRPPISTEIEQFEKEGLRPPALMHDPFERNGLHFKHIEFYPGRTGNMIFVEVHERQKDGTTKRHEIHFDREEFEKDRMDEPEYLSRNPVILHLGPSAGAIHADVKRTILRILAAKFKKAHQNERKKPSRSDYADKLQECAENLKMHAAAV